MKFIDLSTQYQLQKKEINNNIKKVLNRGDFILGKETLALEEKLSQITNTKYCISVANGTDALMLSLIALGISGGDEVITTPFSWISSVEVIKFLGAKPVYVDIKNDFLINENLIEKKITKKTKAILAVSLFGQISNMTKINQISKKYNLKVIEDAAQSFGATQNNLKSCSLSNIGCTSFFPSKPLGCYGDGGACFTNNKSIAMRIKSLRNHGKNKLNSFNKIGFNSRLDTIQAAILLAKIKKFDYEIKLRNNVANNYKELLEDFKSKIIVPKINKNNTSVYAQYTIITEKRDQIEKVFKENKIPYGIYYKKLIPENYAYKQKIKELVTANILKKKVISLPFSPYLKYTDQKKIVSTIKTALNDN